MSTIRTADAWSSETTHGRVLDFGHLSKPEAALSMYEAVVFDLWGTLVDELTHPEEHRIVYRRKVDETADLLGLDRDDFASAWSATSPDRMVGRSPSTEATLSHICRQLGAEPDDDRIRGAAQIRYEYVRGALTPRPGAVDTISTLKQSGYRVGLISNCTEEVSRLWRSTPFAPLVDTAVLSFDAGLAKPDARIYELAIRGLGVSAKRCLYVGDGSDGELSGAAKAGMTAVLIRAPYDRADGSRESWDGETVLAIPDVLDLLSRE